jgi:hypothetical protein
MTEGGVYLLIKGNQKRDINPSAERKGTEAFCKSPKFPHWKSHRNQKIKGGSNINKW